METTPSGWLYETTGELVMKYSNDLGHQVVVRIKEITYQQACDAYEKLKASLGRWVWAEFKLYAIELH